MPPKVAKVITVVELQPRIIDAFMNKLCQCKLTLIVKMLHWHGACANTSKTVSVALLALAPWAVFCLQIALALWAVICLPI